MINLNKMWMADVIRKDERMEIRKSFFGLQTKVFYRPTGSVIKLDALEFSPANGAKLKNVLTEKGDKFHEAIMEFKGLGIVNGNYKLEMAVSSDGAFAALTLLQYRQLNYEPVTDVLFFDGGDAKSIHDVFFSPDI